MKLQIQNPKSKIPKNLFWNLEFGIWNFLPLAGTLALIVFAFPARAADICCNCTPPGGTAKMCLTFDETKLSKADDCTTLPAAAKLDGWVCDQAKLDLSTKCKPIPQNGLCLAAPVSALSQAGQAAAKTPTTAKAPPPIPFTLNVPIPGFTPPADMTEALNSYIVAVYRYMISVAAIAATIMFIYGAFRYLVGSSLGDVARGKEVMIDAVVGLLLVLSATMILRTINPALVSLSPIIPEDIRTIEELGNYDATAPVNPGSNANILAGALPPSQAEAAVLQGAKDFGKIDPCLLLAICEHETGYKYVWSGQQSGQPMEKATSYGYCQISPGAILSEGTGETYKLASHLRELYPDYPAPPQKTGSLTPDERTARVQWLMTNPRGMGYVAAWILYGVIRGSGNNEVLAAASYGAGSGSMSAYRSNSGCKITTNVKISDAGPDALANACVPHLVAIANKSNNCPADISKCPVTQNARSEFVIKCSDTQTCYGMITDDFANYVIKAYPRIKSSYCK